MGRFSQGYIKIYRSCLEGDIGRNVTLLGIWITLLGYANRFSSKVKWRGDQRVIPPGSMVIGLRGLSEQLNIKKSTLYDHLKYLKKTHRITLETSPEGTFLSICNWELYQNLEEEEGFEKNSGHEPDTNRTRTGHLKSDLNPWNHKENEKSLQEHFQEVRDENHKNPTPNGEVRSKKKKSCPKKVIEEKFNLETLYQQYPRREGKSRGLKSLARQIKTEQDYQDFAFAVGRYAQHVAGYEPRFIKLFSSFVSEWRDWLDPDIGKTKKEIKPVQSCDQVFEEEEKKRLKVEEELRELGKL